MTKYGLAVLLMLVPLQVMASDAKETVLLVQAENMATASDKQSAMLLEELQRQAEQGNIEAQYRLGVYYSDQAVKFSDESQYLQAASWYRKAAERGHIRAQCSLAYSYLAGQGVVENHREAILWYFRAAIQGDEAAQYSLAKAYQNAYEESIRDYKRAFAWYHKAASQGSGRAMYEIALMYREGQSVEPDLIEAYAWFELAERKEFSKAFEERGKIAKLMTAGEIERAQKRSEEHEAHLRKESDQHDF